MLLSLKSRLLSVEPDFLSALVEGGDALVAFESRWEGLLEDINIALETPESHPELSALAHIVATRVAALADASIDICDIYNTHSSFLMAEIDNLMSDLSIEDRPFREHPGSDNSKTKRSVSASGHRSATPSCRKRARVSDVCPPEKATKRRRSTNACKHAGNLPSRSPSSPTTTYSITDTVSHIEDVHAAPTFHSSRKRRFSDVDSPPCHPLKRLYTGPRVHAVSDSYTASLFKEQELCPASLPGDVAGSPTTLDLAVRVDIGPLAALPNPCYGTASERGIFDDSQVGDLQASCEDPAQTFLPLGDMDAFLDTLLHLPIITSPQLFASNTSFDTTVLTDDTFGHLSPSCLPLAAPRSPSTSSSSPSSCPRTPPLSLLDCDIPPYILDHFETLTNDFDELSAARLESYSVLRISPSSQVMDGAIQFSSMEYNDVSGPTTEWLPTDHLLKCSVGTVSQIKRDYPCSAPEALPLVQTSCHGLWPTQSTPSS